jgi:hypothetical protein
VRLVYRLLNPARAYSTRAGAAGAERYGCSYIRLRAGALVEPIPGSHRGPAHLYVVRPWGPHGAASYLLLTPGEVWTTSRPAPQRPLQGLQCRRYVTLGSGKAVDLGTYVRGVRRALSMPEAVFAEGLTGDRGTTATGAQVRRQFLAGVHDRINALIPAIMRGAVYASPRRAARSGGR